MKSILTMIGTNAAISNTSKRHIMIGKLIDWLYAKEQSSQSMLKILGYIK